MVTIRPAQPTDATFLAWAMLCASRSHLPKGWFDIVLERPDADCIEFLRRLAVTQACSWWHYSRFHIAEVDGEPAATLCAFRAGDAYPLSVAAIAEVCYGFGWDSQTQNTMWSRGSYVFTCTFEDNDAAWTIENVATLPDHRKRGLAGALIRHVLRDGRAQGLDEAQITFLIGNDAAAGAYANAGFEFFGEKRSAEFAAATGAPGLCRYVRRL
jgi:ribosomal protein S18 acetylase RimI-like enzyme